MTRWLFRALLLSSSIAVSSFQSPPSEGKPYAALLASLTDPTPRDLAWVDVQRDLIAKCEKKYGMFFAGELDEIPKSDNAWSVRFGLRVPLTADEAMQLLIATVQDVLDVINAHTEVKEHFERYPVTAEMIQVSIQLFDEDRPVTGANTPGLVLCTEASIEFYFHYDDPEKGPVMQHTTCKYHEVLEDLEKHRIAEAEWLEKSAPHVKKEIYNFMRQGGVIR